MRILTAAALIALYGSTAYAQNCIPSGTVDQYTYFVAVDSGDFTTRETGLSSFTVYRSRNGGAAAAMTTPTVNETDATNMAGVYELLLDEDMTIDAGDDVQHMVFHITSTGMAPVDKEICIARAKVTAGETLTVSSGVGSADTTLIEGADATDTIDARLTNYDAVIPADLGTFTDYGSGATLAGNVDDLLDNGTASYSRATDSLQAIRDRGDAAWITGGGGSLNLGQQETTIAGVTSQTIFTPTATPTSDAQLPGWAVYFEDAGDAAAYSVRKVVSVSSGAVTIDAAPDFTIAASDTVVFLPAFLADGVDVASWNGTALATTNPLPNAAAGASGGLPTVNASNYVAGLQGTLNTLDALDTAQDSQHAATQALLGTPVDLGGGATLADNAADIAGTTFSSSTDSLEAIRDRGDSAWITGAGGSPPDLLKNTTIATLASQTSFTLTAGSADNNAYQFATAIFTDQVTADQKGKALISAYTGSSRTVTLGASPAFTIAVGDTIDIIAEPAITTNYLPTLFTRIGVPFDLGGGASLAGNLSDIEGQTDDIGAAGAGLTAVTGAIAGLNDLDAAGVRTAVGLASADLDTQLSGVSSSISGLNDLDAAGVRTAVGLASADLDTQLSGVSSSISGLNDLDAAGVRTAVGLASANLDTQLAALPTASENAAATGTLIVEDQGSTYTLQCALATLLAYVGGEWSQSGSVATYQDPSGTESRLVGTIAASSRSSITITCP